MVLSRRFFHTINHYKPMGSIRFFILPWSMA
uniref:Uncharacterized protein n=2 Tax=unclassified Caudoviricetes TaxID=2788787 RepID=A0A8S5MQD7_9CAUD|nr:MAG TPA: hypothetical protein [Siphoviridae sp. ctHSm42]DAD93132.1 MAG TPA: hypothetical protein [Siphoviridae sp. ctFxs15]